MVVSLNEFIHCLFVFLLIGLHPAAYLSHVIFHLRPQPWIAQRAFDLTIRLYDSQPQLRRLELLSIFLCKPFGLNVADMLRDGCIRTYFVVFHQLDQIGFGKCGRWLGLELRHFRSCYINVLPLNKVGHWVLYCSGFQYVEESPLDYFLTFEGELVSSIGFNQYLIGLDLGIACDTS